MRLSSFHIDGFGALADFGREEMAPGLVVVLGPNEAGKTTLFDFFSGVLFGFPTRRDNPRYHAPARGGRHGGRVGFVDEAGGTWTVERHAGVQRGIEVRMPDGSAGDETSLARALAGASSSLFRAVFAVGLDDLGQMEHLESDEVRELLFAASIFGQRRSAAKAMKHLAEARDALARPRRDDATANRVAGDLEIGRAELAEARQEATRYEALRQQAEEAEAQMTAMRSRLKALRNRERELQLLEACWHHYCDARLAGKALSLAPAVPGMADLFAHSEELRLLAAEVSGHLERAAKLEELSGQRAALHASVGRRLSGLGSMWTMQWAVDAPEPALLADDVRAARDRMSAAQTDVVSAAAVLAQSEALRASCPEVGDPVRDVGVAGVTRHDGGAGVGRIPERSELELWTEAVAELRERASEAERLELEVLAGEREDAVPPPVPDGVGTSARPAALVGCFLGLAVSAFGVVLAFRSQTTLGVATILLGVALVVAAGLASRTERRSRHEAPAPESGGSSADLVPSGEVAADRAGLLARTRARIDELAELLGLEVPPLRVDIERCAWAVQRHSEERRRLDDRVAARAEADARVAMAAEADRAARKVLRLEQEAHEAWCEVYGFAATTPEETMAAVASFDELRSQLAGLARIDKAIARLEPSVTSFTSRYGTLVSALGADEADGPGGTLAGLVHLLDEATALDARRAAIAHELSTAETALEHALGGGAAADRIRAELATGHVLEWATERADLEASIEDLRQEEEDAVRRHQSLAEAMQRTATSDRIAELERRQDAREVELEASLRQYLVLGTARALLQRTLSRHERERQPAVVASAATHFERVTGGRYVSLLADGASEGKQTFRVISRTGEAIDAANLSRGSIEQLYLCVRLGLADSFAQRSVSLPIVLDDVLVNFDPDRASAVATELAESARSHQIVFLTCHPHLAELMLRAGADGPAKPQLIELGRVSPDNEQAALPLLTALPPLSA
jgi:uncharacterized protein YhaN